MDQSGARAGGFPTTRHSAILATRSADPEARREAWEAVIGSYWKPACKYIRLRWRQETSDAEELTQAFFTRVLEKEFFHRYDPGKGSFRTYFRVCLDGFLANERQSERREKRGGGIAVLPLEVASGAASAHDADEIFHREWQKHLFGLALEDLRRECEAGGKAISYQLFKAYDLSDEPTSYDRLARQFGLSASAVTNQLAAMRRQLRRHALERLRTMTVDDREFRREARALLGGAAQ